MVKSPTEKNDNKSKPRTCGVLIYMARYLYMKDPHENTPRMFNLNMAGKETARPATDETDDIFSDIRVSDEPPSVDETPDNGKPVTKNRPMPENLALGELPGEQTIAKTAAAYAENQPSKKETAGFRAAGERIRIVVPDDPTDPERTARLTRLGLRAIKTIDKDPDRPEKKDK